MELTITRHDDGAGRSTLVLAGSVDLVTRHALAEAGRRALVEGGTLTLDMADVDFIDSTGLGMVVGLGMEAVARHAGMVVFPRSARVERVLEITGLDQRWLPRPSLAVVSADR